MNRVGRTCAARGAVMLLALCAIAASACGAQNAPGSTYDLAIPAISNVYPLTEDSKPHVGVPAGKTFDFMLNDSKVFPGTKQKITVYIPAGYDASRPACLYVNLDGLQHHVQTVFDNLIAKKDMPVTIAVGVSSGSVDSAPEGENPRLQRSFEFDTRSDRFTRFLLEDVLPAVQSHTTPAGQRIVFSPDPNDHAIGGGSTGGIGSFTVAWEHPDAFRRVFISIGTFVGMRGGESYYVEVRKTEPKPLRIFEQDGANDEWPGGPEMGDWFMSNVTMTRALEFAGYDVKHVWGAGTHSGNQADAVFPDAMRWLWRDYPRPVRKQTPGNPRLKELVLPDQDWVVAGTGCGKHAGLAASQQGAVFLRTSGNLTLQELAEGPVTFCGANASPRGTDALAFGADGARYLALSNGGIQISAASGSRTVAEKLSVQSMSVRHNGDIYAVTSADGGRGALWLVRATGETVKLDDQIKGPAGLAWTPDGRWLFVAQAQSHYGLSYRMLADGLVDEREPFYDLEARETDDDSGAGGVAMDSNGLAYVSSTLGVQVMDRNGRVIVILPLPNGRAAISVAFGGAAFDILFVATEDGSVFRRRLHVTGAVPFAAPVPLRKGNAG